MPAKTPRKRHLDRLQQRMELALLHAFGRYVAGIRADPAISEAVRNSPRGLERLMALLKPYIAELAATRHRLLRHAVASEMNEQHRQLTKVQKQDDEDLDDASITEALINIGFDPDSPRARALMDDSELAFITEFTDDQREAVRSALARALTEGRGTDAAARAFRDAIGLTSYQQNAVDSYRSLLERNSSAALERVLRDRRYDPGLQAAIEGDNPLTDAKIDRMVARYADRYVAMRAETIARTETIKVLNQARDEATRQTVDKYGFAPDEVRRTWTAVQDARTRDTHADMDGQVRGLDEPFESPSGATLMYPGDPEAPADEIINCRCTLQFTFGTGAAAAPEEEEADEGG